MVTGGVTDGRTLDLEGQPHAASALQRVAGIFLDYEKLLSLGLPGLHSLIDEKEKQHPENDANFYEGIRMSLRTVEKVLLWYAGQARELAGREENPSRRADLEEMERICRKLVHEKPETFREAIQLVILYTLLDGARE